MPGGGVLKKIDDAIYAGERALTVALIAIMTLAVFIDVTHRKFSEPVGKVEQLLTAVLPLAQETIHTWLVPVVLLLLAFLLSYAGFRTAEVEPRIPRNKAVAYSAATALGMGVAVKLILFLLPNGLIFSQKMALCAMLWVGYIGASMATREGNHIVFEVADRIWPVKMRPMVRKAAAGSAVVFCLTLSCLALAYSFGTFCSDESFHAYQLWSSSGGVAGVFEGFSVPQWSVFGFLALPPLVMAFRFARVGVLQTEIAAPTPPGTPPAEGAAT